MKNETTDPKIVIVDFGSQYTQIISRTLREMGFRSVIIPPQRLDDFIGAMSPKAIILSGGSASVYEENAPTIPKKILEAGTPILGICYGMQFLANELGGKIISSQHQKEYGEAMVSFETDDLLFSDIEKESIVWESHGDSVGSIPPNFKIIAKSKNNGTVAAMSNPERKLWGIQFHPEVTQSVFGKDILKNFLVSISGCEVDWEPEDAIKEICEEVLEVVGDKKVIGGFSGGVDSTTVMAVLAPALGEKLQGVCIDTGALRLGEMEEVKKNAEAAGVKLRIVDAKERFQKEIGNTTDAEEKRQCFKKVYGTILEEVAKEFGAEFLIQGSLATDIIESGHLGNAALIKSHHNIGLNLNLRELHPFRKLFKYEVRDLAKSAGLPESVSMRSPFPGPGLFIRVIGQAPTPERLEIVRWADSEVTKIIKKHNLYQDISQLIVALICVPTVGIKGDGRSYESSVVVRGVKTQDFMTVSGYQLPDDVRREISNVVTKHPKIVRVWFDETNKPPATTELE